MPSDYGLTEVLRVFRRWRIEAENPQVFRRLEAVRENIQATREILESLGEIPRSTDLQPSQCVLHPMENEFFTS